MERQLKIEKCIDEINDIIIDKTGSNTNDIKVIKQILQNVIFQDSLNIDLYIII